MKKSIQLMEPILNSVPEKYEFFLICAPGTEASAVFELRTWFPGLELKINRGGLILELDLSQGMALNRVLKIPNRVLLRLMDFGCRDFPKLFKKIANFPWEEWFDDQAGVEFHVASRSSRLKIKKRIEETCSDGFRSRLKKRGVPTGTPRATSVNVYVRFEDDVATISLDTSGEILHKRGLRPLSSDAPLRETLAASLLINAVELKGIDLARDVELVDPMMGGGTFLIEGALLGQVIRSREFAFEKFKEPKRIEEPVSSLASKVFSSFRGFELDPKSFASAQENWRLMGETRPLEVQNEDFLTAEPLANGKRRWLIVNPPYGERIRVEGKLSDFYSRIAHAAEKVVQPELACFLLPSKAHSVSWPASWREVRKVQLENGGIPVNAFFFARK